MSSSYWEHRGNQKKKEFIDKNLFARSKIFSLLFQYVGIINEKTDIQITEKPKLTKK